MFLVEAGGKTVLLTGDGHARDIERGLKEAGRLDAQGEMHVDVLKVQHHGSKDNLTRVRARVSPPIATCSAGTANTTTPSRPS